MKLTLEGIQNRKQWEEKGYSLPQYDIAEMRKATKENPFWIHFGAGNLSVHSMRMWFKIC